MWKYTDKVIDFFNNPRNCGSMENADGIGQVGNLVCGDSMKLYIKMAKDGETIEDAKFQTFGCASAIASASALTVMIIGKKLSEAVTLTNQDIVAFLGGLPDEKEHCTRYAYPKHKINRMIQEGKLKGLLKTKNDSTIQS